jgi:hypothetical protein
VNNANRLRRIRAAHISKSFPHELTGPAPMRGKRIDPSSERGKAIKRLLEESLPALEVCTPPG